MSTFVGKINVRQENPPFLSRCIQDSPGALRGILHIGGETQIVEYNESDKDYFYSLPPWVSLARSWDDLDRFIREFNDHLAGPTQTNAQRTYVITKILARLVGADGLIEYRVQWLNYTDAQSTVLPKETISREVTDPIGFFETVDEKLDSGDPASVNVTMAEPPSAWRWRCAWMHLIAPRAVSGFQNRHLKISEKTSFFIQKIIGLGISANRENNSDDAGAEGQAATRQDYNTSTDFNSGQPRCLSYGIHSLLDGGRIPRILGAPRMPAVYEKITEEKVPNSSTEKNPYEILLSTSGGQYVEVDTLAKYLGTGVHVASAIEIKSEKPDIGDGFSDNSGDFETLRNYVGTLPGLCRSLARTMVSNMGSAQGIRGVETMMHWCFGLTKKDNFVVTRADATGMVDYNGTDSIGVHEFKTKWTVSNTKAFAFKKKPLPRDMKQSLLNCLMLAHMRGAPDPWSNIVTKLHYVKPKTEIPDSSALSVVHTVTLGAQGTRGRFTRLAKVAAIQAIARCNRYVDTTFVVQDYRKVVQAIKDAEPDTSEEFSSNLLQNLDLVRLAGKGSRALTAFPPGSTFFRKPQADAIQEDFGWWQEVDSVRVKRPQMGQKWRKTQGLPFFGRRGISGMETQSHANRLRGGAPNSLPVTSADTRALRDKITLLGKKVVLRLQELDENGLEHRTIMENLRHYPTGNPTPLLEREAVAGGAVERGVNAVTIGLLDLQNVSERPEGTRSEEKFPTRQEDYENAVNTGLRPWWSSEVIAQAVILIDEYVERDMKIITGM